MIDLTIGGQPYRITADQYQWILSRVATNKKTGEEYLTDQKYYTRADHLAEKLSRMAAVNALEDHLKAVKGIEEQLARLLGPVFKQTASS